MQDRDKELETLQTLKKNYEEIEIPRELSKIVQDTILKATQDLSGGDKMNEKVKNHSKNKSILRSLVGTAAAIVIFVGVFGIAVNTNQAFAQSVQDVPLLGSLAKVFTASEIKEKDNIADVDALIPEVQGLQDKELQVKINNEVHSKINEAVKETKEIIAEYKKDYLATGGTEADYKPLKINVDYSVKCMTDDMLSFVVYKTQNFANAYDEEVYYNYDLKDSKELALKDVLGKDYIKIANEQIKAQIAERSKDQNNIYFKESEGGFTSINENQSFYISKSGNPVVCFHKYEIAPGAMGNQEFEIVK